MKPLIYFIEDHPDITELFVRCMGEEIDVKCFVDPLLALQSMVNEKPWVIVSDQKIPNLNGDEFLKISRQISPFSIRVLQTAHVDERLLLDSIRKSQLNDFIKKPWPEEIMRARMEAAIDLYRINERYRELGQEALIKDELLKDLNVKLQAVQSEFNQFKKQSLEDRREIECWAPPAIVLAIKSKNIPRDAVQTVVTLAFSIPKDITLPDLGVHGRSLRVQLSSYFSNITFKYGGWRDSSGGAGARITSAHFGLLGSGEEMADAALAAALEFKTAIENTCRTIGYEIPCHIILHAQHDIHVNILTTLVNTPQGPITQKTFELFGVDYEAIKDLRNAARKSEGSSIIISEKLKSMLKNSNWGSMEMIQLDSQPAKSGFLVQSGLQERSRS